MKFANITSFLATLFAFAFVVGTATLVILYGRGYRFDLNNTSISTTGLLVATSDPQGAQVLVDNKLVSATNATVNLKPDWYTVRVIKEGYQSWEKRLRVQGEIVARADAFLFPTSPSLSALSTGGALDPVLSGDGGKLAFVIPIPDEPLNEDIPANRAGVWVLSLVDNPLGLNRDARQVAKSSFIDFSQAILTWSPDATELLAAIPRPGGRPPAYYLIDPTRNNDSPAILIDVNGLDSDWKKIEATRQRQQLVGFKDGFTQVASTSMRLLSFSPDETKVLYEATASAKIPLVIEPPLIGTNPTEQTRAIKPKNVYVYDAKEDRNYLLGSTDELLAKTILAPTPTPRGKKPISTQSQLFGAVYIPPLRLQWLPTSRHFILISPGKIEAMEFDGANRKTVYSGPFWDGFAVPWTNSSKLLILSNLNPAASSLTNLYTINIR